MAYRQYTKCISAANYIGGQYVQVIIAAAVTALPLLIAGVAAGPAVILVALAAIIAYCRWWLYDRLICLGGDICAVGWLLKIEPPSEKSGLDSFDTDYSINLVLATNVEGATQAEAEAGPQGSFVTEQPDIKSRSLDWQGHSVSQWANSPMTAVLHAEFEGAGVYDLMLAALAAVPVAAAAAIVCAIPIIGWIACLILSLIAVAIVVIGGIIGLNDTGNPDDVDPNLGDLHVNDPTGRGADILVVQGTWVYDSAHEGWNEIHPIKHCQKIGTWERTWNESPVPDGNPKRWCEAIGAASDPLTVAAQDQPQNQWVIHPVIDGCDSGDDHDPPPVIK